jgi:hypothetical protein
MEFLTELWLPIVLSAVFVFIVSSVVHMALPIHKSDWKQLPDEDDVLDAMRQHGVKPGDYMFPFACGMKEMSTPEMTEKINRGPTGNMTVLPPGFGMGRALGQWFAYSLVVSAFVAYVASFAMDASGDYMAVFRLTGTVATLVYATSNVTNSIWKGVAWSSTWKFVFDGVLYGLTTAGTFAWLMA